MEGRPVESMIIPALHKTYKEKTVLDTPEIQIPDGSLTAVCGHNGSGKSTLAKILSGILKDDSGKLYRPKQKVGYMSQSSLPFRMSVRRNLLLNAEKSLPRKERRKRADQLLQAIGLSEYASKRANRLSGGQTQRMALARLLMKDYDLLILDEPTASVDQEAIPAAEALILDYRQRTGCTVLLITHSSDQADRLADQVIYLKDGKLKTPSGQSPEDV